MCSFDVCVLALQAMAADLVLWDVVGQSFIWCRISQGQWQVVHEVLPLQMTFTTVVTGFRYLADNAWGVNNHQ